MEISANGRVQCVVAGSYRKFYERMKREVIPIFKRAGICVPYPPESTIVNPGGEYPGVSG